MDVCGGLSADSNLVPLYSSRYVSLKTEESLNVFFLRENLVYFFSLIYGMNS